MKTYYVLETSKTGLFWNRLHAQFDSYENLAESALVAHAEGVGRQWRAIKVTEKVVREAAQQQRDSKKK